MITYICRNLDEKTGETLPCTNTVCSTSTCPTCGGRTEVQSQIFWCNHCEVPIYEKVCPICGKAGKKLTTDLRPVFPEERLLLELILDKPLAFLKQSVWNGSGNRYYADGKRIEFSVKSLKDVDVEKIRSQYQKYEKENTDVYFQKQIEKFIEANRGRYEEIVEEANEYIRESVKDYSVMEMFVSFSGGKDSTVVSDLVMRALGNPKILHIFGDTTLEFPFTYDYVKRFKQEHPQTPIITSRNKEKDFEELCQLVGPPSRVMRWCCTVFKTGSIQKTIKSLFRSKTRILTFYGIRRSESASRNKYDRDSDSPKITKQRILSPIIDWMDFDIWLYLLTTGIDFNDAYRLGYARVGCWCCPNNSGWSEFLSKVHMPEQSRHFREMLLDFARQIGKKDAEVYVDEGYWKARQGGNGIQYAQKSVISFEPCATQENTYNYELTRPITEELYQLFRPFGYLNFELGNERLGEVFVLDRKGNTILKLQGRIGSRTLKVTLLDKKVTEDKIKCQITKYQMCIGCMACESVCRQDAISLKEREDGSISYEISEEKCVRCGECIAHFSAGCYMRKVLTIKRN
ncbi:MAG: phosphoadenosine phosphosulfate reductase family protein [Lachnospiraceae bacterium]|nr:phosphoadenosine phosphosulfate reductase family protein [Lachnospiraceae bacterium]MDD7379554.1 phosphoadenosine phosphosulfate reductase family protein [Lachnospiraceae bacterium]MDY4616584.1 phosphoadenosine phosphosulfate reductase family protein [Lachnospiraceae bacterium]